MLPDLITHFDARIDAWAASVGWPAEAFVRLCLATVAGGMVGLEREVRGRQAGFRTNILVCLGSAITMLVSIEFARHKWPPHDGMNLNVDPARIAYGVMTGIGFLGAGAIIKSGHAIRGLTTAAALWCVAAIGLACGFGQYTLAVVAATMVVIALWILDFVETLLPKARYRIVVIRRHWAPRCIADTVERFKKAGLDVADTSFERSADLQTVDISLSVAFTRKHDYYTFERQMESETDITLLAARNG